MGKNPGQHKQGTSLYVEAETRLPSRNLGNSPQPGPLFLHGVVGKQPKVRAAFNESGSCEGQGFAYSSYDLMP